MSKYTICGSNNCKFKKHIRLKNTGLTLNLSTFLPFVLWNLAEGRICLSMFLCQHLAFIFIVVTGWKRELSRSKQIKLIQQNYLTFETENFSCPVSSLTWNHFFFFFLFSFCFVLFFWDRFHFQSVTRAKKGEWILKSKQRNDKKLIKNLLSNIFKVSKLEIYTDVLIDLSWDSLFAHVCSVNVHLSYNLFAIVNVLLSCKKSNMKI